MSALVDRLTVAKKASRELDAQIAKKLGWTYQLDTTDEWKWTDATGKLWNWPCAFTTSLDATFAEAQRRGLRLVVDSGNTISGFAKVYKADDDAPEWIAAATPALAACAALIAAVEAG